MRTYLLLIALVLSANTIKSQPSFTICRYVSQKTNAFVEFVHDASKLVKNRQVNDTLVPAVKARMKAIESELKTLGSRTYNYSDEPDLINYSLTRCYTAYFTFLIRLNEEKLVEEVVEKNTEYFTFVNPGVINCEIADNVKTTVTRTARDDEDEPYDYTTETYLPKIVAKINLTKKEVLQNKAPLFSSIILAAAKLKNYAMVDKYFETAYNANVWINEESILPVTSSKYAMFNYDEQAATVPTTTLHAAISYIQALLFWTALQTKIAPNASDSFYHQRSVDILLKVGKAKLDASAISREDLYKLMATVLRDKAISSQAKVEVLKLNFDFYTSYQPQGEYNPLKCLFLYDIFDYLPGCLKDIWASNDKKLIQSVISYVNQKKIFLLDDKKQLLYDVYLYCRDNGYKSAGKEIYNATLGKYNKDQYPK